MHDIAILDVGPQSIGDHPVQHIASALNAANYHINEQFSVNIPRGGVNSLIGWPCQQSGWPHEDGPGSGHARPSPAALPDRGAWRRGIRVDGPASSQPRRAWLPPPLTP